MLVTTLYGVIHIKKVQDAYRWIVYQLVVTSVGELLALYTLTVLKQVAYPVYHVLNPIEFLIYALFFLAIADSLTFKRFIVLSIIGLLAYSVINSIWLQPTSERNSNAYLSGGALMVVYSLIYYYELYQRDDFSVPIVQVPSFWIVSGIFFLYLGSFFVMGLINMVLKYDTELASRLYVINLFLNILLYAFTFYGLRWAIHNRKS